MHIRSSSLAIAVGTSFLMLAGCAGGDGASDSAQAAEINAFQPAEQLRTVLASLERQRSSPPLAEFYEGPRGGRDGTRITACWANPVGNDLSDLQKAFYCSLPLEFRLCNSPVVLETKKRTDLSEEARAAVLMDAFIACQTKTTEIYKGLFVWPKQINDSYLTVFVKQKSGLLAAEEAAIVRDTKPSKSGVFAILLIRTVASLQREASALGLRLDEMVQSSQLEEGQQTSI